MLQTRERRKDAISKIAAWPLTRNGTSQFVVEELAFAQALEQ